MPLVLCWLRESTIFILFLILIEDKTKVSKAYTKVNGAKHIFNPKLVRLWVRYEHGIYVN